MTETLKDRRRAAGEGGFTLIELLVVIVILGILAAVVVFAVSGVNNKGETAACKTDTSTIRTAEEAYLANLPAGSTLNYVTSDALVTAGFLSSAPTLHGVATGDITPYVSATQPSTYKIRVTTTGSCGTAGNTVGQTAADI